MKVFDENKMLSLIILAFVLFLAIRAWYREHYQYWIKRGFPSDGPNFPLDSLTGTGTSMHNAEKFDEYYWKYKCEPIVGLFFVFTPAVAIHDPELIRLVIANDDGLTSLNVINSYSQG